MVIFAEESGQVRGQSIDQFHDLRIVRRLLQIIAVVGETGQSQQPHALCQTRIEHVELVVRDHNPCARIGDAAQKVEVMTSELVLPGDCHGFLRRKTACSPRLQARRLCRCGA